MRNPLEYFRYVRQEKRRYRALQDRVGALPEDFRYVYRRIEHYMWSRAGGDGMGMIPVMADLLDLFEQGAADGKRALEVTGADVAGFCDELLRTTRTWTAQAHDALNRDIARRLKGRNAVSDAAIVTRGLRKSFRGIEVLKGVDLAVARGEVFALLGSNGSGKTTTIQILATLLRPDGGSASVGGFDVLSCPGEVRKAISLTGQFTAVDDMLTGRENLVMVARLRHLDDPRGVAADLLDRFGLADAAERRAATYSGGMKRRLDLAMSLAGSPPLLFLDEPTTGLDPEARRAVWDMVKQLARGGTTVFLTTQYLDEAEELADRIAILHGGRIIADASLEELARLLPPARVEYVQKQPTLEEIYLHLTGPAVEPKENAR